MLNIGSNESISVSVGSVTSDADERGSMFNFCLLRRPDPISDSVDDFLVNAIEGSVGDGVRDVLRRAT